MTVSVGDRIPEVELTQMTADGPARSTHERIFQRPLRRPVRRSRRIHADLHLPSTCPASSRRPRN